MAGNYDCKTVIHTLKQAAGLSPQARAIQDGARGLSYAEFWQAVQSCAFGIAQMAQIAGSRVVLIAGNSLDSAVAIYAIQAAGAQLVPVNPAYTARELAEIVADAEPALILYEEGQADLKGLLDNAGLAGRPIGQTVQSWAGWMAGKGPDRLADLPAPDQLALLQYTGGTTGRPKGVNITHRQMAVNVAQREAALPTCGDDVILCVMPLFHVFASSMCLYLAARCHGLMVIQARYHPQTTLELIARYQVTCLPAGPTIIAGLMGHEDFARTDLSSLRAVYSGSAALPRAVLERWEALAGCPIYEGYGQSEAGPVLSYQYDGEARVPGTVGRALPDTEIQIVDVETGLLILAAGERGEIRARGPQIMSGYRNRPEETAAALRDGWLYTGDIGQLDETGLLTIQDRKKDMVISAGFNIYPREIEELLASHADIAEAAVIGQADDYRGEVLLAFLVARHSARLDLTRIEDFCRAGLAPYKIPARFMILDALPRTSVGKIDKPALKALAAANQQPGRPAAPKP